MAELRNVSPTVIAVLGNLTVVHRMVFTFQEAKLLEGAGGWAERDQAPKAAA